jgi:DNA-3-methyladenine glycosylase I
MKNIQRCDWAIGKDALMTAYHDAEWGVPLRNDTRIFEFLVLESFQAGLSWRTILNKRRNFEKAFSKFDPVKVATFSQKEVAKLLKDTGIIRNHAKIEAAINNAKRFLEVKKEFGTFSKYMWSFVGGKPIVHRIQTVGDYKPLNQEALDWAKDLKKRGFKFLGPTTVYAHMQATGMVNDHMVKCFRKNALTKH